MMRQNDARVKEDSLHHLTEFGEKGFRAHAGEVRPDE